MNLRSRRTVTNVITHELHTKHTVFTNTNRRLRNIHTSDGFQDGLPGRPWSTCHCPAWLQPIWPPTASLRRRSSSAAFCHIKDVRCETNYIKTGVFQLQVRSCETAFQLICDKLTLAFNDLKMIGKGFYSKWVKSSFEQFITTQTRVGSTNRWIISQNTEILKFYFSTISGNLRNLWRHLTFSSRDEWRFTGTILCVVTKSVIYRTGCIRATDIWCQTFII